MPWFHSLVLKGGVLTSKPLYYCFYFAVLFNVFLCCLIALREYVIVALRTCV